MRRIILAALTAATVTVGATAPAAAQRSEREYRRDVREARQEYREDIRDAGSRRDVRDARREYRNNVRDARRDRRDEWRGWRNYDYNHVQAGQRGYYADRYYRDGRYYQSRTLGRNDRLYRGNDGRYYCRRPDGTTGLLIGGLAGGALGNLIAPGGSKLIGTLIGGGAGGLLGNSVARGNARCR